MTRTVTMRRTIQIDEPIPVEGFRDMTAKRMSEKELMGLVVEAAQRLNWYVYHTFDSRRSEPGFPDLILIERDYADVARLIAAELKRERESPTQPQLLWLAAFDNAGAETYVWRPSQWMNGEIEAVLRGRS